MSVRLWTLIGLICVSFVSSTPLSFETITSPTQTVASTGCCCEATACGCSTDNDACCSSSAPIDNTNEVVLKGAGCSVPKPFTTILMTQIKPLCSPFFQSISRAQNIYFYLDDGLIIKPQETPFQLDRPPQLFS